MLCRNVSIVHIYHAAYYLAAHESSIAVDLDVPGSASFLAYAGVWGNRAAVSALHQGHSTLVNSPYPMGAHLITKRLGALHSVNVEAQPRAWRDFEANFALASLQTQLSV
eukprot:GHVT01000674.1.p1 GENE.GHVT01000674.1~~GHVT01000674.1.p1  ORF type:complete len:110 (-),score=11.97 GHVT01000674.1:372-701(-)